MEESLSFKRRPVFSARSCGGGGCRSFPAFTSEHIINACELHYSNVHVPVPFTVLILFNISPNAVHIKR